MKFFRFAFMGKPEGTRPLRPHEIRDGDVFVETSAALTGLGHKYAGRIINHPVERDGPDNSMEDVERLGEDDLLVISSRPPMNEKNYAAGAVRVSFPSKSRFEQGVLFKRLREFLVHCERSEIGLDINMAEALLPQYRDREQVGFYLRPAKQRFEAAYSSTSGRGNCEPYKKDRTTAGYLIHTGPLDMGGGKKGPRVLAAFGVSGTVGIVFAHQLWKQKFEPFRGLLEEALTRPSLSMVEITVSDVPGYFTNLDFSDDWEYKLITRRPADQR